MVAIHSPDASLANPTRRSRGFACGDILIDVMHDTPGPLLFLSHWPRVSEISGTLLRAQTSGEASCAFRKAARASSSVGASTIGACGTGHREGSAEIAAVSSALESACASTPGIASHVPPAPANKPTVAAIARSAFWFTLESSGNLWLLPSELKDGSHFWLSKAEGRKQP